MPDALKAGVNRPCRYEPDPNPTYLDMAAFLRGGGHPGPLRTPRKDKRSFHPNEPK